MKKVLFKTFLFLLPFFLYGVAVVIIDPFSYFWEGLFLGEKENVVKVLDSSRRLRLVKYKHNPKSNIIIGASQAEHIDTNEMPGDNWANICNGGANISDELYTFWQIVEKYPIDTVLFSVEPYNYLLSTGTDTRSVTTGAFKMLYNPLYYFTDTYVNKAFIQLMKGIFDENSLLVSEAPNTSQDVFWEKQSQKARREYNNTIGLNKDGLDKEIMRMVNYCRDNNITLIGIVPIGHTDLYEVYSDYKPQFLNRINKIFPKVYDFFFPNDFTEERKNFGDPFHAKGENYIYINGIYHNDSIHCKKYINENDM